jgi:hypothetical protein
MKPLRLLVLAAILCLSNRSSADDAIVPPVVLKGFQEFQKNGTLAAMDVWLAGSARDNDEVQDRASAKMTSIQGLFGRVLGHEVIRTVILSPSTRRVYAAVKFEKGVAWMSFDCYKPEKEWIISRFDFGTNANLVLPPNILGGQ